MIEIILILLISPILITALILFWYVNLNYRFEVITKGKFFRSGLIPTNKLEKYLFKHKIKTVISFLDPGIQDKENPEEQRDINNEREAIEKINKKYNSNINFINIPSNQTPTKESLTKYFEILDDPKYYPILVHCYHGRGRAAIYTAIYRIEKENFTNEDARDKTRAIVQFLNYKSSFADGKQKGDYLMNYIPRRDGEKATINTLGSTN